MIPPFSPFLPIQHPEDLLDNLAERRATLVREFENDRASGARFDVANHARPGRGPLMAIILPLLTWFLHALQVRS